MLHDDDLHLALDARTVHAPVRRGTGKNLVDLYSTLMELRPNWRVTGLHRSHDAQGPDLRGYRPQHIDMPGDRFDAWQRWRLPHAAWQGAADLLHCPANTCPTWNPVPVMLTVHDLLPLEAEPADATRFDRSVRHAVEHSLTIITPSVYTRDQLIDRYRADEQQVVVNAWAPDRAMRFVEDPDAVEAVLARYGVTRPFMLHLGAPASRKNTQRVLSAYAAMPGPLRREFPLLVVGVDQPHFRAQLQREVTELGVASCVHLHGFADEADMPALFSAAEILVYPSLSEGFGLPILDAFVTRTAVLTSSLTSLPEVGGDAAFYACPTRVDEIRDAMQVLATDDSLRRTLTARGLERARQFTWHATAQRFIHAVQRTLDQYGDKRHAA